MTQKRHSMVGGWSPRGFLAVLAFASLAFCTFLTPAAPASELVEVRVALHEGFTRVVFEADGPFEYRLPEPGLVLRAGFAIWLDTATGPRMASISGDPLPTARVDSAPKGGSDVWIRLEAPVTLRTRVLQDPDRLVVDLVNLADLVDSERVTEVAEAEPTESAQSGVSLERSASNEPASPMETRPVRHPELSEVQQPTAVQPSEVDPGEQDSAAVEPLEVEVEPATHERIAVESAEIEAAEPEGAEETKAEKQGSAEEPTEDEKSRPLAAPVSAAPASPERNQAIWLALAGAAVLLLAGGLAWARPRAGRRSLGSASVGATLAQPPRAAPAELPPERPAQPPEPAPTERSQPGHPAPADSPREQSVDEAPSGSLRGEGVAPPQDDPRWAADLLQMLRQLDERLAVLETQLTTVEREQSDTRSWGVADRRELELHRGALARLRQSLIRSVEGRRPRD